MELWKLKKQGGDYVERKQNNNDKVTIGPRHQQQVMFYDKRFVFQRKNNITAGEKYVFLY